MSILYIENEKRFVLETANTTYQMKIDETGVLRHLYYGRRSGVSEMSFMFRSYDHGYSGNPYEMRLSRDYSLDTIPQEYPSRGTVAMSGVFGYELDLTKLSEAECREIGEQIRRYKELEPLILGGRLYRLSNLREMESYAAWQYVSRDGSRAVLNLVITNPTANFVPVHVLPKGLLPDAVYSVGGEFECSGLTLMRGGYTFPRLSGDYPSLQIDIIRKQ